MFIEQTYGVTFAPHEVDKDNLDTLERLMSLLMSKNPRIPV